MKILISTDIEGVAGCSTRADARRQHRIRTRPRLMTAEANAAIRGAFDGGATERAGQRFARRLSQPAARRTRPAPAPCWASRGAGHDGGLEDEEGGPCHGVFMVGYHARRKAAVSWPTPSTALPSRASGSTEVRSARPGIYGSLAAEYGVPVLLASGDDVFTFVQTKKRDRVQQRRVSLSPEQSREAIRAGVAEALAARGNASPLIFKGPLVVTLRTQSPMMADLFCQWPAFERVDGVTLRFTAGTVEAAVRMLNCCSAMSSMLR
jgi:D-amino peptidase